MAEPQRSSEGKPKRLVGEYRVVAELARGGMGKVYLAQRSGQAGFERNFAIKVMHQQLTDNHDAVLMLLDEAHIASKLHHPNVVPVLDIGSCDEGHYLVMDYVEGCSLQQIIKASPNSRPAPAIVSVMLGALRGLHAVHTLRGVHGEAFHVVHRDVSPHNILLGLDGGSRVTDFGIAKARQRFTDTQAGTHKSKLAFMSPEQILGNAPVDCRTDIWSAGVTMYTALTGQHPFRRANDGATLHAILSADIIAPSRVGLFPPACLDDVIMRALERDPAARYATAEEFADALRSAALQGNVLGAPGDVARWVESCFGETLAARRRMVAALPRSEETTTSGRTSLPKLWFTGEGTGWASGTNSGLSDGEAPARDTESGLLVAPVGGGKFRTARASVSTQVPKRPPSRSTVIAVMAGALCMGTVLAFTIGGEPEQAQVPRQSVAGAKPQNQVLNIAPAAAAPAVTPEAQQPAAAQTAPSPMPAASPRPHNLAAAQGELPSAAPAVGATPPKSLTGKPGMAAKQRAAEAPVEGKAAASHSAPPDVPAKAAARPEPMTEKAASLDRNPYVLGE